MTHDVFISYAHGDRAIADMVCASLEQEGVRCWIAPRDVKPGADWGSAIVSAIRASRVLVLLFSDHANASKHIPREIERAVNHEVPIVPFRIETVEPRGSLEYSLSSVHWLDAFAPPIDPHLRTLGLTVRGLLGATPDVQSAPSPPKPPAPRPDVPAVTPARLAPAPGPRRRTPIALAALLIVAVGALAAALIRPAAHPPDLGFEPTGLAVMEMSLSQPIELDLEAFCTQLEQGGAISSAAAIDILPFGSHTVTAKVEGKQQQMRRITPRYFNTMGISLLRGRTFTTDDGAESGVAILNESAAGSLVPGQDPLGRSVSIWAGDRTSTARVVGVVDNIRQTAAGAIRPVIYVPLGRRPPDDTTIVSRATGSEAKALQRMQEVGGQSFPAGGAVSFSNFSTMNARLADVLPRSAADDAVIGAAAAFLAVVLVAIGVHYMRQRRQEPNRQSSIPTQS